MDTTKPYYKRWVRLDPVAEKYYREREAETNHKKAMELKKAEEIREYLKNQSK